MVRVAFLTSEFISEKANAGGLGNYLNRISQALLAEGHCPEIFVVSGAEPASIDHEGVRVHRVRISRNLCLRIVGKINRRLPSLRDSIWGGPNSYLVYAYSLKKAFSKRHAENPFDFVQSTNCHGSGLLLKRDSHCPHLVRLSSKRDLWFRSDGQKGLGPDWIAKLERKCVRRADIAYAPSQYIAAQCRSDRWRSDVHVVRPPLFAETAPAPSLPFSTPGRYFVHFGQFGFRKGSFALARALCKVWQQEPEFKMVWAGRPIRKGDYEYCHQLWKEHSPNVTWVGSLPKPLLYATIKQAEASVLPSIIDNLPNTAIESLVLKVPVIAFRGGSLDELVEPGVNGELVEMENEDALAESLIQAWRRELFWCQPDVRPSAIFKEMEPQNAVRSLLKLALAARTPGCNRNDDQT